MKSKGAMGLALITIALSILTLNCVSPFYGTARIEPGWHMDAGVAGTSYMIEDDEGWDSSNPGADPSDPHYYGIRGDMEVRYGFNQYIQGNLRTGLGWGFDGNIYGAEAYPVDDNFLIDIAAGSQFAYPMVFEKGGQVTLAARIEACYGYGKFYAYPALMVGIGNPEFLTIGGRYYLPNEAFFYPTELFVSVHVWRFDVFAGINLFTSWLHPDYWRVPTVGTIGVGFAIK